MRRAFTLIELLVVISIVALLIAILLPALSSARDAARLSACLSNTRQIAIAHVAYGVDNGQSLPAFDKGHNQPHAFRTSENAPLEHKLNGYLGNGRVNPDTGSLIRVAGGAWICPSSPIQVVPWGTDGQTRYQHPDQTSSVNAYTGLYYHWVDHYSVSAPATVPTNPSWNLDFFTWPGQMPIHWCSVRLTTGGSPPGGWSTLGARSWHGPNTDPATHQNAKYGPRPTAFMDGHAAALSETEEYIGDSQDLLNGKRDIHQHRWHWSERGNGGDYALSEY